jgi:uncharacterized protein YkwD
VARSRFALITALCVLLACAGVPAAVAVAARRAHTTSFHRGKHRTRGHRASCAGRSARRARHTHAHRASFHSGSAPRHLGRHCLLRRHDRGLRLQVHHSPAAANSSACVDADLTPTAEDLDRVRAATLCLVNRERTGQGESPLVPNARLAQAAQAHSDDMAHGDYFDHVSPSGGTPLSRMRAAGYIFSSRLGYEVGENIGWGTLWLATPRAMVSAWMASPEHRANILDGHYRDTAIGVSPQAPPSMAQGQAGAIYTQDFGLIITA